MTDFKKYKNYNIVDLNKYRNTKRNLYQTVVPLGPTIKIHLTMAF